MGYRVVIDGISISDSALHWRMQLLDIRHRSIRALHWHRAFPPHYWDGRRDIHFRLHHLWLWLIRDIRPNP